MNTLEAIAERRSIRKFKSDPISDESLQAILNAAIQAPSGKNRQPWRFIVVKDEKRQEMVNIMRTEVEKVKAKGESSGSAEWTVNVMEQAPITVFIFNPDGIDPWMPETVEQRFFEVVDTQSIGAAIQNMLLAATELKIGSLWICDIFVAYRELRHWLGEKGQMIAAVSFGVADSTPPARPRKLFNEVVRYL